MYLDHKFGLNLSLSEISLLFDLSLYLDRTLAQRKAQRKAKSKVKVAQCLGWVIWEKVCSLRYWWFRQCQSQYVRHHVVKLFVIWRPSCVYRQRYYDNSISWCCKLSENKL